jgi:hypothetical protein
MWSDARFTTQSLLIRARVVVLHLRKHPVVGEFTNARECVVALGASTIRQRVVVHGHV